MDVESFTFLNDKGEVPGVDLPVCTPDAVPGTGAAIGLADSDRAGFETVALGLTQCGYSVVDGLVPHRILQRLVSGIDSIPRSRFKKATIGRRQENRSNTFVRNDRILWLDSQNPAATDFLNWMEGLREALNRRLFLGLFDYECHFAHYPPGSFYKKHLDAFKGSTNRVLSTVLYLNTDWDAGDGGELIIYDAGGEEIVEVVTPTYGRMVFFLSEEFPHEVKPALRDRYSVAGWFRVNASGHAEPFSPVVGI